MVTGVLATGCLHIVEELIPYVDSKVVQTLCTFAAPVLISVIPVIVGFVCPIFIVKAFVGGVRPRICMVGVVISTWLFSCIENSVDPKCGYQPRGNIINSFVAYIQLVLASVDYTSIVCPVIECKVALELVRIAAQGEVVLLSDLPLVNSIGILLCKIVFL
ncbi:hypothetical protein SDC9_77748 [bioreactor metagenome]|uniref:Uncharacterized protein n=1 Tax=bioreactor metagenome TaxID=1076179 RepID=A0A644YZ05_9ZZZZ